MSMATRDNTDPLVAPSEMINDNEVNSGESDVTPGQHSWTTVNVNKAALIREPLWCCPLLASQPDATALLARCYISPLFIVWDLNVLDLNGLWTVGR
jgi:hypothetical protein